MSALVPCGECGGKGTKGKKMCEWCEGTGQIEVPDGFRKRKSRTKADLKRIEADQQIPHDTKNHPADATVIKAPPARMTISRGE